MSVVTMAAHMDIADFEMKQTLGVGTFGRVKYARYKLDAKFYAVKMIRKHEVIQLGQTHHVNNEKRVLMHVHYPFVVQLFGYAKDDRFLYLVMENVNGGDLFTHLRRCRKFSDTQSSFYGFLVSSTLVYLHNKNIVHRDLKLENLLLQPNGYLKLADFGFSKIMEPGTRTYTVCGTPEYMAPEVLLTKGHGKSVDWWSLGVLIYEMLCGQGPFCDEVPMGIYQKIVAGKIYFPKYFDKSAKFLIKRFLVFDLSRRFGNLKNGHNDVIKSRWFSSFNLARLESFSVRAPYVVPMQDDDATSNYQDSPESIDLPPSVISSVDPFIDW